MIETMVDLGEGRGSQAMCVARIWPLGRTGGAPKKIAANISGLLAARHFPGLVKSGDCVAVVAVKSAV